MTEYDNHQKTMFTLLGILTFLFIMCACFTIYFAIVGNEEEAMSSLFMGFVITGICVAIAYFNGKISDEEEVSK